MNHHYFTYVEGYDESGRSCWNGNGTATINGEGAHVMSPDEFQAFIEGHCAHMLSTCHSAGVLMVKRVVIKNMVKA